MSALTVGLACTPTVLGMSDSLEMVWIETEPVSTQVIYLQTLRNLAVNKLVNNAMYVATLSSLGRASGTHVDTPVASA